jgi:hypothetical protein
LPAEEPAEPWTTSEKEPSGFWPKSFLRMFAAFSLSYPGRAKRFVSRSERPDDAAPAASTATIQTAKTAQRKRIIVRAQRVMQILQSVGSRG